jgi:hypothetical protein
MIGKRKTNELPDKLSPYSSISKIEQAADAQGDGNADTVKAPSPFFELKLIANALASVGAWFSSIS